MILAERFMYLFRGATSAHGTYGRIETRSDSPKGEIKRTARTLREPVTTDLWQQHLDGTRPLGIIPIDESANCYWGVVDIDVYEGLSHQDLVTLLASNNIPAQVCRSKSGGAHVFLFFSEPVPAEEVMPQLRALAAFLGHGDAEIFPKQDSVNYERGDLGNWLNMPYFAHEATDRYATSATGLGMSATTFLLQANAGRLSRVALRNLQLARTADGFKEAPPCLESLIAVGFKQGTRNAGLMELAKLAKKMNPDGVTDLTRQWNATYFNPPLPEQEVNDIIKSVRRRDYKYGCKKHPIINYCNVSVCRHRKYGITDGAGGEVDYVESLTIIQSDPKIYIIVLKTGERVEMAPEDFSDQHRFQVVTQQQVSVWCQSVSKQDWESMVSRMLRDATHVEVPDDVGTKGQFVELLLNFLNDRYATDSKEDIPTGRPWRNPDDDRVYFMLEHLQEHLLRRKFTEYNRPTIYLRLRELGGESWQSRIGGAKRRGWSLPAARVMHEAAALPIPKIEDAPI